MSDGMSWEAIGVLMTIALPIIGLLWRMSHTLIKVRIGLETHAKGNVAAHRRIDERFDAQGKRLDEHGRRIDEHERRITSLES